MADLVEQLRSKRLIYTGQGFTRHDEALFHEAADRITTLETDAGEIERLKRKVAALEAEASKGERMREAALSEARNAVLSAIYHDERDADVAYAAILVLIPEAPVRDGWQPIETAPKGDPLRSILIATRGYVGGVVQVSWSETAWDFVDQDEDTYPDATHWRPLPAPPQDNREG